MNKWQALTDIVKAFVDGGSPGYAFGAVCVVGTPIALGTVALAVKLLQ